MDNYMRIKLKFRPWAVAYMYIDSPEHYADPLLLKHGVKKAAFKDFVSEQDKEVEIIFIKFPKRYESKFFDAMEELKSKCLLMGFRNYEEKCNTIFGGFAKFRGGMNNDIG